MRNEEAVIDAFGRAMGITGLALVEGVAGLQIGEDWLFMELNEDTLLVWVQGAVPLEGLEAYKKALRLCDPQARWPIAIHVGLDPNDHLTAGSLLTASTLTQPDLERTTDVLLNFFEKTKK